MTPLPRSRPCLRRLGVPRAGRSFVPILARGRRDSTTVRTVRRVGRVFGESVLQFLGVNAWLLEGAAPATVREGQQGGPLHVACEHFVSLVPGGQRARGLRRHEVAPQAVDSEFRAEGRDPEQDILIQSYPGKPEPGRFYRDGELVIRGRPYRGE